MLSITFLDKKLVNKKLCKPTLANTCTVHLANWLPVWAMSVRATQQQRSNRRRRRVIRTAVRPHTAAFFCMNNRSWVELHFPLPITNLCGFVHANRNPGIMFKQVLAVPFLLLKCVACDKRTAHCISHFYRFHCYRTGRRCAFLLPERGSFVQI